MNGFSQLFERGIAIIPVIDFISKIKGVANSTNASRLSLGQFVGGYPLCTYLISATAN